MLEFAVRNSDRRMAAVALIFCIIVFEVSRCARLLDLRAAALGFAALALLTIINCIGGARRQRDPECFYDLETEVAYRDAVAVSV